MQTDGEKWRQAYLQDHAKRVYGIHLGQIEEVAAAFIARYGLDPADAMVVTTFDEGSITWRSHIERRRREPTHRAIGRKETLPGMPSGG